MVLPLPILPSVTPQLIYIYILLRQPVSHSLVAPDYPDILIKLPTLAQFRIREYFFSSPTTWQLAADIFLEPIFFPFLSFPCPVSHSALRGRHAFCVIVVPMLPIVTSQLIIFSLFRQPRLPFVRRLGGRDILGRSPTQLLLFPYLICPFVSFPFPTLYPCLVPHAISPVTVLPFPSRSPSSDDARTRPRTRPPPRRRFHSCPPSLKAYCLQTASRGR